MVVRCIAAERRRGTGRISVAFQVDSETWANMQRSAQDGGYADSLDYVAKQLGAAFGDDAHEREAGTPPAVWNAKNIKVRSPKGRPARISFEVEAGTWANMHRSADDAAHPDVLDYMAGRLNVVFMEDEPPLESGRPKPATDTDDDMPF
jgi:hypothetical protein